MTRRGIGLGDDCLSCSGSRAASVRPMKVLYTAIVQAEGGREGRVQSLDGNLDVNLALPKELGGAGDAGSNPEQLLAAGWAACFQNAMHLVAKAQKLDLTDSSVTAEVDLGMTDDGGFQLAGRLL